MDLNQALARSDHASRTGPMHEIRTVEPPTWECRFGEYSVVNRAVVTDFIPPGLRRVKRDHARVALEELLDSALIDVWISE
jgi:hypothetical protein